MYYIIKLIQAVGLTIIFIDFLREFPEIMNMRLFGVGIGAFVLGWILEKIFLRK